MTEARRNEIAYLFLLNQRRKDGVGTLKPNDIKRQICNTATELEIPAEEAQEFVHDMMFRLFQECFPMPGKEKES
ncbi:hypothetical protein A2442_00305 [Candidatus Campbellbacteria bacterium RIFOXYC2_FULL_35_25]|uniref:Uncharacterized protein n=1 Tax=Candidatus Campbellbacteria bacterium RIFOXYC2_FULL_35_25 TaxID=1797582 RepID=A0A1F5EIL9_9BACT|nr:MAG: hypothetical protein A2442_00305 [Candidatus Campbellbacteria bacterium RIFOXYC2_FULL_35_25]